MPTEAFISYSHADEEQLKRLHTHMAMLRREGAIKAWTDHEISAGGRLDSEIKSALEKSDLFLALVSPDYLASRYCYEEEFQHALLLEKAGSIRIVPIIVEPCEWKQSPFKDFKALPKDGKSISEWTNKNIAYLEVVTGIRALLSASVKPAVPSAPTTEPNVQLQTGRRPRLKRDFDAIQKSDFLDKSFGEIRSYFEASCNELNLTGEGNLKARFETMDQTAFTCSVVNRAMQKGEAHITVRNGKRGGFQGEISYLFQRWADNNTSNGFIHVEADDYALFLTKSNFMNPGEVKKNTAEQVAESLWLEFVSNAGIEYE